MPTSDQGASPRVLQGAHEILPQGRIVDGRPASEVVAEQADVPGAQRVFLEFA
jgi:hypothetical protein